MNNKRNDSSTGIGVVAALIVAGVASPLLFKNIPMMIAGTFLVSFGITGLGIELDNIYTRKIYTNIFLGCAFLLLGILVAVLLPNIFTKSLLIITLMLGVFGLVSGIIKLFSHDTETADKKRPSTEEPQKKILSLIVSIVLATTGFLANIFTILAFFKG
ncbi:hypothetical protein [Lapidilactobacillus wuchangensis]|uniref:hypothetical protein n=1 Tax=Lapidilactobacillus wuchangensis TaxID=2486001 RepID=UPI000F790CEC|nr:hypothetical protein [Lapidilactobacillus wuchangensis]